MRNKLRIHQKHVPEWFALRHWITLSCKHQFARISLKGLSGVWFLHAGPTAGCPRQKSVCLAQSFQLPRGVPWIREKIQQHPPLAFRLDSTIAPQYFPGSDLLIPSSNRSPWQLGAVTWPYSSPNLQLNTNSLKSSSPHLWWHDSSCLGLDVDCRLHACKLLLGGKYYSHQQIRWWRWWGLSAPRRPPL